MFFPLEYHYIVQREVYLSNHECNTAVKLVKG